MSIIKNRIAKRVKFLRKWAKTQQVTAYRIYDRDIPEYPYQIDVYGSAIVIFDRSDDRIDLEKSDHFDETIQALTEIFDIGYSSIFTKSRRKQKGKEQYEKLSKDAHNFIISEAQARFHVNLSDYLDTGLFLDHRPLRQIIYKESEKIEVDKVLNLFSYTSSIGVFAALAGAFTTNVDLSNTYLDWSIRNYELNGLVAGEHKFINADVKNFLEEDEELFDIIILDPPTFSNSKSMRYTFDIKKLAGEFIHLCMKKLNPDGVLYFSTNKRDFKMLEEWKEGISIIDISQRSIPEDFRDKKIHKLYKITN